MTILRLKFMADPCLLTPTVVGSRGTAGWTGCPLSCPLTCPVSCPPIRAYQGVPIVVAGAALDVPVKIPAPAPAVRVLSVLMTTPTLRASPSVIQAGAPAAITSSQQGCSISARLSPLPLLPCAPYTL